MSKLCVDVHLGRVTSGVAARPAAVRIAVNWADPIKPRGFTPLTLRKRREAHFWIARVTEPNAFTDRSRPEYGTMEAAWKGALVEADRLCELHLRVRDSLVNDVIAQIKNWQKDTYHKIHRYTRGIRNSPTTVTRSVGARPPYRGDAARRRAQPVDVPFPLVVDDYGQPVVT
ncbi:Protein kinase C and casein kinase substrate in neurons protein 1 [Eumeta japonica]|uniref:Protein kinase C and casein kinase substrate in neurons protein 1 n=1 Tax=Eumeta variegata TaxID=151549 RepID=A0A4C1VSY3_EUMVA|nr:Protein kinase C and casein kinase substrate in neurons protein 1 [Eumeta japonica]